MYSVDFQCENVNNNADDDYDVLLLWKRDFWSICSGAGHIGEKWKKDSLVWTKECSMVQSFSFDWEVKVIAVCTIVLEWVEWTFLIETLA